MDLVSELKDKLKEMGFESPAGLETTRHLTLEMGEGTAGVDSPARSLRTKRSERVRQLALEMGEGITLDSVYEKCVEEGIDLPKKTIYEVLRLMGKDGTIKFSAFPRRGGGAKSSTPKPKPKAEKVESVLKEMVKEGLELSLKEIGKRMKDEGVDVSPAYLSKISKPFKQGNFTLPQIRAAKSFISAFGHRDEAEKFLDMFADLVRSSGSIDNARSLVIAMFDC